MKNFLWILYSKYNGVITWATITVFALLIATGGYLGIKLFLLSPSTILIERNLGSQRQQLAMAERDNADFKGQKLPKAAKPVGHKVIDRLQQLAESEAASAGCRIDQFSSPAEQGAYLPHYGTDPGDYGAFHIRMTISGNLGQVFAMLQSLSDGPVPFEFTSLALTPNGQSGDATSANVEMDVLSKKEAT